MAATETSSTASTTIPSEALFGLGPQPDSTGLVPEPSTGSLVALGLLGLAASRKRR
jgi:hypothetical protein